MFVSFTHCLCSLSFFFTWYSILYVRYFALVFLVFFFKQKTAYEMRISDWSSDVCSSDLNERLHVAAQAEARQALVRAQIEDIELVDLRRHHQQWALVEIGRASCRERVCQYV